MPKKILSLTFINWLPFAATIIIFSCLVCVAVQQNYRQSANDPQIQIAEDLVTAIGQGQPADQIVPAQGTTEMSTTLSPFVMIYSATSTLIGSSAVLDGKNPSIPSSALDYAKLHGQDRFTWQPEAGVREAVVILPFNGVQSGFVVAGRSLKEIEIREAGLNLMCGLAGLLALIVTFILLLFTTNKSVKHMHMEKITEIEIQSS